MTADGHRLTISGPARRGDTDRPALGEVLETALGAVHYSGQLQRATPGGYQDFQDWGWAFVELSETLYSVNRALDRQVVDHSQQATSVEDRERLQQMRHQLAMLTVALADARVHARGYYDLASRLGTLDPAHAQEPVADR